MELRDLKLSFGHCHIRGRAPEQFKLLLPLDQDTADEVVRGHVGVAAWRAACRWGRKWGRKWGRSSAWPSRQWLQAT